MSFDKIRKSALMISTSMTDDELSDWTMKQTPQAVVTLLNLLPPSTHKTLLRRTPRKLSAVVADRIGMQRDFGKIYYYAVLVDLAMFQRQLKTQMWQ